MFARPFAVLLSPRALRRAALTLALLLSVVSVVAAQTETGRVTGVVMDSSGGVLPGVVVTARAVGSGATRTLVTDTNGQYLFASLPPGAYELKAELSGFRSADLKVLLTVGGSATANVKLEVAGTTETVIVSGAAPVINVTNSEISTTINEAQIRELPTITRNVYDLVGVAGNVTQDAASNRGTGFAINGQRSASTNILLDGSANNDEFRAGVGQQVPLDSVQEFSVVTGNFSAQYGRATGGVVNVVTKSGTNSVRGTAYDFYRSDKLATNTVDNRAKGIKKGEFTRHQAGFSIGGPIKRDRMHFFSNAEYIRVRSTDTLIGWIPTPQFIAASAPATREFFSRYAGNTAINGPTLTRAQVSAILGSGAGAFNSLPADLPVFGQVRKALPIDAGGGDPQDNLQWVSRVDYSLSNNAQMYLRYALQDLQTEPGTNANSVYSGYDTGAVTKNHNLLGSFTRVFSSTFTTQSKIVWNRLDGDQPLNGDPQPTLYMNPSTPIRLLGDRIAFPGYLPWTPGSAIPSGGPQKLLQLYQDQTWVKGKHDLRFGGSFVHIADDRTFGAYANAVQALNTTSAAIPSLDGFVNGQIRRFQTAINPGGYPGGTYVTPVSLPSFTSFNTYDEYALYANDNWSIGDRLTLNLGMRYEFYGPQQKSEPKYDSNFYYGDPNVSVNSSSPKELVEGIRNGRVFPSNESPIENLWKPDKNNFAPRVGFAWDVFGDGKTSVRGGYGLGYERNFGNVTFNVLFNPPQYLVATIDAPTDVPSLSIYTDTAGPFGGVAGVRKTIPGGSLRHIDQNIETAYAHFYGASVQRELRPSVTASIEYSGSTGRKLYDLADPNKRGASLVYTGVGGATTRPNPNFAAFNSRGNRGQSQYHGVTFGFDARSLGTTGLQVSTKYTLGHTKDNLSSTFSEGGNNYNLGYLDAFDPLLDYGWADFDVRHRLSVSAIYELPFARNATGLTRALAGGWQLNGIFTARTGYPFTLHDCTNGLGLCMRAQDPTGANRNAIDGATTGSPNSFNLLDLKALERFAGGYRHPLTGNSDFGPYPADMTERNAFRGPGFWNVDLSLSKRARFSDKYAVQFRVEAYNVFDHANMFARTGDADISSVTFIEGFKEGNRRLQLGLKFEF